MASTPKKLRDSDIDKKLKKLSDWTINSKRTEISKSFPFDSFINGFTFVARIAVHAEVMGHHPDIELSFAKVKVRLATHDVKGLTNADFELAQKINSLGS